MTKSSLEIKVFILTLAEGFYSNLNVYHIKFLENYIYLEREEKAILLLTVSQTCHVCTLQNIFIPLFLFHFEQDKLWRPKRIFKRFRFYLRVILISH